MTLTSTGVEEATFGVPTIHCEGCIDSIEDALFQMEGVEDVRAELEGKIVTVAYHGGGGLEAYVREELTKAGHFIDDD